MVHFCTASSVVYTDNTNDDFMNAINTTVLTQNVPQLHIQPLTLWQFACGGRDLPTRDYQHIMVCTECETLATEIRKALDDLGKVLGRRQQH